MQIDRRGLFHAVAARRWAMHPEHLIAAAEIFINAHQPPAPTGAALSMAEGAGLNLERNGYYIADNVAVIEIAGIMLKNVPMSYADEATSTLAVKHALDRALADSAARSILLLIDSPGGEARPTQELADAIFTARGKKPIHAHISDMGASAAYWVASQADTISANRVAAVGSIGTYTVLDDWSEAYAASGVKVHLLTSGAHKGVGVEGVPISEDQLAPIQAQVDALAAIFTEAVRRGRNLSAAAVNALADGRVWLASDALALKLIDRIENSDEALERASSSHSSAGILPAHSDSGSPSRLASGAQSTEGGEEPMRFSLFGKRASAESAPKEEPKPAVEETPKAGVAQPPPAVAPATAAPVPLSAPSDPPDPSDAEAVAVEAVAVSDAEAAAASTAALSVAEGAALKVLQDRIAETDGKLKAADEALAGLRAQLAQRDEVIKAAELLGSPEALTITPVEDTASAKAVADRTPALGASRARIAVAMEARFRRKH